MKRERSFRANVWDFGFQLDVRDLSGIVCMSFICVWMSKRIRERSASNHIVNYLVRRRNRSQNQIIKHVQLCNGQCADRKTSTYQGKTNHTSKTKFEPMANGFTFDQSPLPTSNS